VNLFQGREVPETASMATCISGVNEAFLLRRHDLPSQVNGGTEMQNFNYEPAVFGARRVAKVFIGRYTF
jgi:hypothetical protein